MLFSNGGVVASLLVLGILALSAGCTVNASRASASASDGGGSGPGSGSTGGLGLDGGAAAAGGLTCVAIFDCAAACPEGGDDTCANACLERGSEEGKAAATSMAACFETHECTDGECLKASCGTELTACVTQKEPEKPIDGAPPGVVPADLVGKWHHFYGPTAHTHDFTFGSDGTAAEYITTGHSMGGCGTTGLGDSTGTVVFAGTTMTYYKAAGTEVWNTCGKETVRPATPSSREYQWSLDASGNLVLVDRGNQACLDNPSSCTSTYTRQ